MPSKCSCLPEWGVGSPTFMMYSYNKETKYHCYTNADYIMSLYEMILQQYIIFNLVKRNLIYCTVVCCHPWHWWRLLFCFLVSYGIKVQSCLTMYSIPMRHLSVSGARWHNPWKKNRFHHLFVWFTSQRPLHTAQFTRFDLVHVTNKQCCTFDSWPTSWDPSTG